jgi:hypothetical protein
MSSQERQKLNLFTSKLRTEGGLAPPKLAPVQSVGDLARSGCVDGPTTAPLTEREPDISAVRDQV